MAPTVVLGRGDPHSATPAQLLPVVALAWTIHESARVGLDASVRHARERECAWTEIGQVLMGHPASRIPAASDVDYGLSLTSSRSPSAPLPVSTAGGWTI